MEEKPRKLMPSIQNRLNGILKKGEVYIVRHRQGTEKVKIMKKVDLRSDELVKVKNVDTNEEKDLKVALCYFTKENH
jgi:hypothetical protein